MQTPPRSRLQVDERRQQLLELALRLFGHQSYEEISIDAIAKAAGVSKGLLYHYFPSKRAFYVAAIREAATELMRHTDASVAAARTGETAGAESLRAGIEAYLGYVETRAVPYAFLLRGGLGADAEVAEIIQTVREHFAGTLRAGIGQPAEGPRMRVAILGFIAFVEAASLDWVEHRSLTKDELTEVIMHSALSLFASILGPRA